MRSVVGDFETASRADLQKIGAWKYAADMSTFITHLSIKQIIDKRPQPPRYLLEKQLHAIDPELMELAKDPEVIFIAHNGGFEQAMWHFHMVPMGYPPLGPERWHDTMAAAAMKALPLGLDAVVTALELPIKKDMEGHALMMKMCKPDKDGGWSHHTPENLKREGEYCNGDTDAQYGLYVATQGLGPSERHTWILDQIINQRGIKIDTEFVDACIDVLDQVRVPMTARFRELTGLNPTQREKVLNWVNDQGVPLGNMQKATLSAILDADDEFDIGDFSEPLPYHVHEVLTLRRSLGSASVAKLARMLQCAGADGRVRYATQYHAARTGRDGGRLIQIQNYPVGEIGDRQGLTADILADAIMTRDLDKIREVWGPDIFSAVVSSLRACVVPEKGKVLVTADYAAVECRNLLSFAGQHDRVDQMHSGQDVYSEVASMIFKRPINRKLPEHYKEGKIGKQTILGCLADDTLVLTRNGWKPIVSVKDTDLLWDGGAWVTHSGLAFKGYKETLNLSGLRMTPDHPVFTGLGWLRADRVKENTLSLALAFAKVRLPLSALPIPKAAAWRASYANAIAEMARIMWTPITFMQADRPVAILAQNESLPLPCKNAIGNTQTFAPIKNTVPGYSIGYRPFKAVVALAQKALRRNTMPGAEFGSRLNGFRKAAAGSTLNPMKPSGGFLPISSPFRGGIIRLWKSIASKMTAITSPEIFGSQHSPKMPETSGSSGSYKIDSTKHNKSLKCCAPVYDLVDAGPNHRFTVLTDAGPLIVHNSGYGLGPVGFRARFAPKESIELAKLAIDTYRKEVAPLVPRFWYGLWQASVDAVWCDHAKTYSYAGIEFRKEGDFLTMRLPSSRKIWYHRPRKTTATNPVTGDEHPSWTFMSYQGKKFRRHMAWHGMITADCVQGSARDLLKEFEKRAHSAGLFTIFRVHDELVFEEFDRPDLCETVRQVAEDISQWAIERKFRVAASVASMLRYQK